MPWVLSDVDKHKAGLSKKQKELWLKVANPARERCLGKIEGTPSKEQIKKCEGSAIRQANAVVGGKVSEVQICEASPSHEIYLTEKEGRKWRVGLIDEGMSGNRRLYTGEVLREAVNLFEGAPSFADHPTTDEEAERPERSIRDKMGVFENPVWESDGIKADFIPIDPWLREVMLTSFNEGVPDFVQFSINAKGLAESEKDAHGKYQNVTRILSVQSVDVVTQAAAGGKVIELLASQKEDAEIEEERMIDWKELTVKELADNCPELLESIRVEEKAKAYGEKEELFALQETIKGLEDDKVTLEAEKTALGEKIAGLEGEKAELEGAVSKMTVSARMVEASNVVVQKIAEAELPDVTRKKLTKLFEVTVEAYAKDGSEEAGAKLEQVITDAIEAERVYLDELMKQPEITGMGKTEKEGLTMGDAKTKLKEAFMRHGHSEEEAEEMAGGRNG